MIRYNPLACSVEESVDSIWIGCSLDSSRFLVMQSSMVKSESNDGCISGFACAMIILNRVNFIWPCGMRASGVKAS